MDSDTDESGRRKSGRRNPFKQLEQLRARADAVADGMNFAREEDRSLENSRDRCGIFIGGNKIDGIICFTKLYWLFHSNAEVLKYYLFLAVSKVLKRYEDLKDRLSRDSDKMVYERLLKDFEAARVAQSDEILLSGEQWNDGLLATIRERVHMEADRKAMGQTSMPLDPHFNEKPSYRIGNKVLFCLEGSRIGIQYETSFAGEPCETFHCVLESKSFLEKLTVIEHTIPFFLPIREAENDFLSSNAMKFIDYVGALLQSYVDRREQVRLIKELYGNQIGELFHSLTYNLIEFVLDDFDCKVTVSLRYTDLVSVLPSRIRVLAWPVHPSKKALITDKKGSGAAGPESIPSRLPYAEDALRTMSLPEAYAEIVLNLPRVLEQIFSHTGSV